MPFLGSAQMERSDMKTEFGRKGLEIDPKATGQRISELRIEKDLRVTDISDYMGFFEPQAVYKWMRGDSLPTLQNMYCLSQLFDTPIDDIIRCAGENREEKKTARGKGKERGDGDDRLPLPLQGIRSMMLYGSCCLYRTAAYWNYHFPNHIG